MNSNANYVAIGTSRTREISPPRRPTRLNHRARRRLERPGPPAPKTPEEKAARKQKRSISTAQKQADKRARRAEADKPIAGKDGDFNLENECTLCLQKGHVKKQCPLPRPEARGRARDVLMDGYKARKEAIKAYAARVAAEEGGEDATAGVKEVAVKGNRELRKEKKARKRAAREAEAQRQAARAQDDSEEDSDGASKSDDT